MTESDLVYLIASFPDAARLRAAAEALDLPRERLVVLGSDGSGADALAGELGVGDALHEEIHLDDAQRERLAWHREHRDEPLLAVEVMAEQGRDVRLQITEMGGRMLTAPDISTQANDVAYDPGMGSERPDLPPPEDRIFAPN